MEREINPAKLNVDVLTEADLPVFSELVTRAFASALEHLVGKIPPGRRVGERVRSRFYRPDTRILTLRDSSGEVAAALPVQKCGTRGIPGPLAIADRWQEPWQKGVGPALLDALMSAMGDLGLEILDAVTFPHSPTHFKLYWNYGMPVFEALKLSRPVRRGGQEYAAPGLYRWSALTADERERARSAVRSISAGFHAGFDVSADIQYAHQRSIGETFLLEEAGETAAFAICHFGDGSESYAPDQCLIKYLHVDPRVADPGRTLTRFMDRIEAVAASAGLATVGMMVSTARRVAVDLLLDRGYRILSLDSQWLMTPAASSRDFAMIAAETFRPDQLVFADWR
jgi:hypothetical protein